MGKRSAGVVVHIQQVIGEAVAFLQRKLADRDAAGGVQIDRFDPLNGPAGNREEPIDLRASLAFWIFRQAEPLRQKDTGAALA